MGDSDPHGSGRIAGGVVAMVLRHNLWLAGRGVLIGGVVAGGMVKLLLWWSAGLALLSWDTFAFRSVRPKKQGPRRHNV